MYRANLIQAILGLLVVAFCAIEVTSLLPPKSVWNKIQTVDDLSDFGQMVGHGKRFGDDGFGVGHAFLMTPVHPTMTLAAPVPGRAGEVNRLTITGAVPGAIVRLYYSRRGGGALIPGCDIQQNVLQLEVPKLIGTAIADENGEASMTKNVQPFAQNQWILMQAVVGNECAISQLVVHQFE